MLQWHKLSIGIGNIFSSYKITATHIKFMQQPKIAEPYWYLLPDRKYVELIPRHTKTFISVANGV